MIVYMQAFSNNADQFPRIKICIIFSFPRNGRWGSRHTNGTWNGIINSILMNETQIGLASFINNFDRSTVVAFSPTIYESPLKMFIKIPGKDHSWMSFLNPFLDLESPAYRVSGD